MVWVNQQHPFWIDEGMDLHFLNARIEDTYMPLDSSLVRKGLRVAHDTREIQVSFACQIILISVIMSMPIVWKASVRHGMNCVGEIRLHYRGCLLEIIG